MAVKSTRKTYYRGYWIVPVYDAEAGALLSYLVSKSPDADDAVDIVLNPAVDASIDVPGKTHPEIRMTVGFDTVEEAKDHIASMTGEPRGRVAHGRRKAGYR